MEGHVESTGRTSPGKSAHLMCGSKIWTIAGFITCAYFTRIAVGRIHNGNAAWSHDAWDIATHGVWVLFMVGLLTETKCWKERIFFALVLVNFALASVMGLWTGAPDATVNSTRVLSAGLWALAALVSAGLIFAKGEKVGGEKTG